MNARNELIWVFEDLEALADHCIDRFHLDSHVDLVAVLDQPHAPNNRSALTSWIGAELRDPELHNTTEIGEIIPVRLAAALTAAYPLRWADFVGSLVAGGEFLEFPYLEAMLTVEDAA
jgi:hypothetical protein